MTLRTSVGLAMEDDSTPETTPQNTLITMVSSAREDTGYTFSQRTHMRKHTHTHTHALKPHEDFILPIQAILNGNIETVFR